MQHISEAAQQFIVADSANAKNNGHKVPEKILKEYHIVEVNKIEKI